MSYPTKHTNTITEHIKEGLQHWIESFDRSTYHRGKRYAIEQRVTIDSQNAIEIKASVQGSEQTPYQVLINWEKGKFSGTCTCPIQHQCKHMLAVAFTLVQNPVKPKNHFKTKKIPLPVEEALSDEEQRWLDDLTETSSEKKTASLQFTYILKKKFLHRPRR